MNENVKVSLQLVNGILQYLGTRPYGEVFQIVNAIHAEVQQQIQNQINPPVVTPPLPWAAPQA